MASDSLLKHHKAGNLPLRTVRQPARKASQHMLWLAKKTMLQKGKNGCQCQKIQGEKRNGRRMRRKLQKRKVSLFHLLMLYINSITLFFGILHITDAEIGAILKVSELRVEWQKDDNVDLSSISSKKLVEGEN